MNKFRLNSIIFITVIGVIFCCNVYYLMRLYESIRTGVESEVMTAIANADIDDLILRATRANDLAAALEARSEGGDTAKLIRKAEVSAYREDDESGQMSVRTEMEGSVTEKRMPITDSISYANQMVDAMSKQLHSTIDGYIGFDMTVMDSVLNRQLNRRLIYPEFVAVEVVDSNDHVVCANTKISGSQRGYDVFKVNINPYEKTYYKVYITPLTSHILSQMKGVIITIFLLMVTFALAFRYLFHTVSKLRTIEEMKDDFVSNMTHELKTPISIAYSANDALLNYDTSDDPEKRSAYLKIALKQLRHLGELVENILAMSMERRKTMTLKPESIYLPELIEDIAGSQLMRGDKDITIITHTESAGTVVADKSHLSTVLNNLVDNAIKYSGDSVSITIGADSESITVSDNGIGIPSKSLPFIFDKFYRVPHGNRQGVRGYGIGLYYVRYILEKMGWSISVKSQEGHGSTFTINFDSHGNQNTFSRG